MLSGVLNEVKPCSFRPHLELFAMEEALFQTGTVGSGVERSPGAKYCQESLKHFATCVQ